MNYVDKSGKVQRAPPMRLRFLIPGVTPYMWVADTEMAIESVRFSGASVF